MKPLADEKCDTGGSNLKALSSDEAQALLEQLDGWKRVVTDGVSHLQKTYRVKDFAAALGLANRIGELADQLDHHPTLRVEWGRLAIDWWTHSVGGLSRNDFIMAAKTDRLAGT